MHETRFRSERGAVLIQVAVGLVILIAITSWVVDYGILQVGRHQAQNSADAAALAGAVALALDDYDDRTDEGPAKTSARTIALANDNLGEDHDVAWTDITFPPCPNDGSDSCIRVDVYRNVARGNPLPIWFGRAVGLTDQGTRATATAQAAVANASDCLKPFGIPDKWLDVYDVTAPIDQIHTEDDGFERYYQNGQNAGQLRPNPDVYVPPGENMTGYQLATDLGRRIVLKAGRPQDAVAPGFFFPVRLPRADGDSTGGSDYRENIATCNGVPIAIGETIENEPGNMLGPTMQGMRDLIALDPSATWNETEQRVENSCAQASPPCASRSPRIVAIPVFDTDLYHQGQTNGLVTLRIVNILGFFINRVQGNEVSGYFTTVPGLVVGGAGINREAAFMMTPQLVR